MREAVDSGDTDFPVRRGLDVGPWDFAEVGSATAACARMDFGGLLVPKGEYSDIHLNRVGAVLAAVTLIKEGSALQLQAFRCNGKASWGSVREQLGNRIRRQGGAVDEYAGHAGLELRGAVAVTRLGGRRGLQSVRMVGCDGPGWLLRGVVTGEAAELESRYLWPYETFSQVVVVPGAAGAGADSVIGVRAPVDG
jgi:hypothetical protein